MSVSVDRGLEDVRADVVGELVEAVRWIGEAWFRAEDAGEHHVLAGREQGASASGIPARVNE